MLTARLFFSALFVLLLFTCVLLTLRVERLRRHVAAC